MEGILNITFKAIMFVKSLLSALILSVATLSGAQASVITIGVSQDASIGGNSNQYGNTEYRWVGAKSGGYFSIFGFDISSLAGKTITSLSFSAFHNYSSGNSTIGALLGANNNWNSQTVTSYNPAGAVLASQLASSANLNQFETWNLGAPAVSGNLMTVVLKDLGNGWNDYASARANTASQHAYLTVNLADNKVPEPATLGLLGLALAGLGMARRRKAA